MISAVYEFDNRHPKDFSLFTATTAFTNDTILSIAEADVLLHGGDCQIFQGLLLALAKLHWQLWSAVSLMSSSADPRPHIGLRMIVSAERSRWESTELMHSQAGQSQPPC